MTSPGWWIEREPTKASASRIQAVGVATNDGAIKISIAFLVVHSSTGVPAMHRRIITLSKQESFRLIVI